jgi:hypothetical protein
MRRRNIAELTMKGYTRAKVKVAGLSVVGTARDVSRLDALDRRLAAEQPSRLMARILANAEGTPLADLDAVIDHAAIHGPLVPIQGREVPKEYPLTYRGVRV